MIMDTLFERLKLVESEIYKIELNLKQPLSDLNMLYGAKQELKLLIAHVENSSKPSIGVNNDERQNAQTNNGIDETKS